MPGLTSFPDVDTKKADPLGVGLGLLVLGAVGVEGVGLGLLVLVPPVPVFSLYWISVEDHEPSV